MIASTHAPAPSTAEQDARYFRERLEAWQDANRDMGERFASVLDESDRLLAVNAELVAALRRAEYFLVGQDYLDALQVIRAALAKAGAL